jgi:DNA polymerase III sliding clamp (beta) subunit (PCNA family)
MVLLPRATLVDALRVLGMATSLNAEHPEFSSVHIEVSGKYLVLSASDGQLAARAAIELPAEQKEVRTRVGISLFAAAVRSASSETISLDFSNKTYVGFEAEGFRTRFAARSDLPSHMLVIDKEDRIILAEFSYEDRLHPLSTVSWVTPQNPTNPSLADVHLVSRDKRIEAVASDLISMVLCPTQLKQGDFSVEGLGEPADKVDLALPSRFVSAIERLGLDVGTTIKLYTNAYQTMIAISVPGYLEITSPVMMAKFPDYSQWLHLMVDTVPISVNKKDLTGALNQINSLLTVEKVKVPTTRFVAKHGIITLGSLAATHPIETTLPIQQILDEEVPDFIVDAQMLARGIRSLSGETLAVHVPRSPKNPVFVENTAGEFYILMQRR